MMNSYTIKIFIVKIDRVTVSCSDCFQSPNLVELQPGVVFKHLLQLIFSFVKVFRQVDMVFTVTIGLLRTVGELWVCDVVEWITMHTKLPVCLQQPQQRVSR